MIPLGLSEIVEAYYWSLFYELLNNAVTLHNVYYDY